MTGLKTLAALLAASFGGAATAQDYTPVPPQFAGEIVEADAADGQGRRFDDYLVELARGNAIVVSAAPAAGSRLEPAIEIHAVQAGRPLASDDADPGTRAARLSFTAPDAGVYRIRILGGTSAAGRYTLQLRRAQSGGSGHGFAGPTPSPSIAPDEPTGGGASLPGPVSRFIICPGHRRCPR